MTLVPEDSYLCLDVPGLAKRKQAVMRGDKLIFSACNPGGCGLVTWHTV